MDPNTAVEDLVVYRQVSPAGHPTDLVLVYHCTEFDKQLIAQKDQSRDWGATPYLAPYFFYKSRPVSVAVRSERIKSNLRFQAQLERKLITELGYPQPRETSVEHECRAKIERVLRMIASNKEKRERVERDRANRRAANARAAARKSAAMNGDPTSIGQPGEVAGTTHIEDVDSSRRADTPNDMSSTEDDCRPDQS